MYFIVGGRKKMKDMKTWKSRSKEKVGVFISDSLFPARKQEAVTQVGFRAIDYPTQRITQGAGIVKGLKAKQNHEPIPDTFTYNKNDTIADPLNP